jgi:hypothetical protein
MEREFEKSFATDDHAELLQAAGGKAFTFFERDRGRSGFTKSASDVISRLDLQEHMPPDDQFGVHLIALGSEAQFGPNRNGDSWSDRALAKHFGSFEKFGCVYREHKNKNPVTQGIGTVRLARVNPKMQRGELIVWVEKDKAPDMYKKAKAGEELSFSMSCRLPHDECSCCRKKSKRTTDYCSHLKKNMLQFVPGFEKYAYARNEDDVKFFDISEVKRRADRIATYLSYTFHDGDEMAKAASGDAIITGAQWAEFQFGATRSVPFSAWEDATLEKLATAAEFVKQADAATREVLFKVAPQDLSSDQIEVLAAPDFRNVGGELAKKAMVLNFHTFASLVTGQRIDDLKKNAALCGAMGAKLPSLLEDMLSQGGCACGEDAAEAVAPDEAGCSFSPGKDNIDRLMHEVGGELGMKPDQVSDRAMRAVIIKSGSAPISARDNANIDHYYGGLIEAYGHYLVKAAHQIKDLPEVNTNALFRGLAASLLIAR